jgi:predicted phosphodiesterase
MMKIALISDIHGNAVALEAVLEDIHHKQVDQIAVLGDICFRGPEPKRALELVQALVHEQNAQVIKGNVDEWTVRPVKPGEIPDQFLEGFNREREWCVSQLTQDDLDWLAALPHELRLSLGENLSLYAFHATPESLFDVVWADAPADKIKNTLIKNNPEQLLAYGHIHFPYIRFVQGKAILNTGSVGLPFDGLPLASYIMLESDGEAYQATMVRVPYDVERVVQLYVSRDYPEAELMAHVVRQAKSPFDI